MASKLVSRRKAMLRLGFTASALAPIGWASVARSQAATQYFNVKDYGATGNGSSDDSGAINAAISAAGSAGGGVVFFPIGRYRVDTTISISNFNGVTLMGSGPNTVLFSISNVGAIIRIGSVSGDLNQTTKNGVRDLSIDRAVAAELGSIGIHVERARYTEIENVEIHNQAVGVLAGAPGPEEIPCQFVSIIDCNINTSSIFGFPNIADACIRLTRCADITIQNVFCEPRFIGIDLQDRSNGVLISKCKIINGGEFNYGLVLRGDGFARFISDCIVENARDTQIYIASGFGSFVTGCWLGAGDFFRSVRRGVIVESPASDVLIGNCRISNQGVGAIYTRGSDVTITSNIVDNATLAGGADSIIVDGGTHVNISNNRVVGSSRRGISIINSSDFVRCTGNDVTGQGISNSSSGSNIAVSDNFL